MGRWRLYLMPSGLRPCRFSGPCTWIRLHPPWVGAPVARAKFAGAARLRDMPATAVPHPSLEGRAQRAAPRREPLQGAKLPGGCRGKREM